MLGEAAGGGELYDAGGVGLTAGGALAGGELPAG
jgi:hypothetical protein